jgi:hypothetical protein
MPTKKVSTKKTVINKAKTAVTKAKPKKQDVAMPKLATKTKSKKKR